MYVCHMFYVRDLSVIWNQWAGNEESGVRSLWYSCAHTLYQLTEVTYQAAYQDVLVRPLDEVAELEHVTSCLFDHWVARVCGCLRIGSSLKWEAYLGVNCLHGEYKVIFVRLHNISPRLKKCAGWKWHIRFCSDVFRCSIGVVRNGERQR